MKKILTLLIIHKEDQVLLGMKKRGVGMGKFNGFGGKVQEGESIEEAARRELFEEAEITVGKIEEVGLLDFVWQDKPNDIWEVHVFRATDFAGQPTETEEMKPQWFGVVEIPYAKMWSDDQYWFPLFLENKKFKGRFALDKNNDIVEHQLSESA